MREGNDGEVNNERGSRNFISLNEYGRAEVS